MASAENHRQYSARLKRYRVMRNWALGVALNAAVVAVIAANVGGGDHPANATSASLIAALLRSAVVPLVAASIALALIGAFLHALSTRGYGEV